LPTGVFDFGAPMIASCQVVNPQPDREKSPKTGADLQPVTGIMNAHRPL
jgi:hypothetical protein